MEICFLFCTIHFCFYNNENKKKEELCVYLHKFSCYGFVCLSQYDKMSKRKVSRIRAKKNQKKKKVEFIIFTPFLTHFIHKHSPPIKRTMHKLKRQLKHVATVLHIFLIYVNFIPFISYFLFGKGVFHIQRKGRVSESWGERECMSQLTKISNRVRT